MQCHNYPIWNCDKDTEYKNVPLCKLSLILDLENHYIEYNHNESNRGHTPYDPVGSFIYLLVYPHYFGLLFEFDFVNSCKNFNQGQWLFGFSHMFSKFCKNFRGIPTLSIHIYSLFLCLLTQPFQLSNYKCSAACLTHFEIPCRKC